MSRHTASGCDGRHWMPAADQEITGAGKPQLRQMGKEPPAGETREQACGMIWCDADRTCNLAASDVAMQLLLHP